MKPETEDIAVKKISFPDNSILRDLFGERERNLKLIERLERVKVQARGNTLTLSGSGIAVALIENLLSQLYGLLERGYPIYSTDVEYAYRILCENNAVQIEHIFLDTVFISSKKRTISPKSIAQKM